MVDAVNLKEQEQMESYIKYYKLTREQYYNMINSTPEQWLEINENKVIINLKQYFIEERLVITENITVTDEELDLKLEHYAKTLDKEKKDVKRDLIKKEKWEDFKNNIAMSKLREVILEKFRK